MPSWEKGPRRPQLDLLVHQLGLCTDVEFLGRLESQESVFALIKSATVFALPTTREGFGIAVAEALACGTQVVTTEHDDNQARHLIEDGVTGYLCDPTVGSLADALEKALSCPLPTEQVRGRAMPAWQSLADDLGAIYVSLVPAVTVTPDMSVVVCTYNRADRLGATLHALERQTIRDRLEVLIVDDGSVPSVDEGEVARCGAKLVRHPANKGPAAARNTGAAASRAPIVAFTDDDCRPAPEWARSLLSAYRDHECRSSRWSSCRVESNPVPRALLRFASSRLVHSRQRWGAVRR